MKPDAWPPRPEAWIVLCIFAYFGFLLFAHFSKKRKYNRAWRNYVEAYQRNDHQEMVNRLTETIGLYPETALLYLSRGAVLVHLKKWDQAIADFSKFIRLRPNNLKGYCYRGTTYGVMGVYELARVDIEEALRWNPDNAMACINKAWLMATCPLDHLRDGETALRYGRRSCELTDWKYANALGTFAAAHAEIGDFATAIQWLTKAFEASDPYPQESKQRALLMLSAFRAGKPFRDDHWMGSATGPTVADTSFKEARE